MLEQEIKSLAIENEKAEIEMKKARFKKSA